MLKNKKREFLYMLGYFGPGVIFNLILAYFLSAVNPIFLNVDIEIWSWGSGPTHALVVTAVFGILFTISRVFDALIDVPVAKKLDKMTDKYKRLRLPILIAIVPSFIGVAMLCLPLLFRNNPADITTGGQVGNTIWFVFGLIIFFTSFTLTQIAFQAGIANISKDRKQRVRMSYFKSFIDTVQFALVFALTPLILTAFRGTGLNVMHLILMMSPLLLTLLIPVIMSRGHKGYDGFANIDNVTPIVTDAGTTSNESETQEIEEAPIMAAATESIETTVPIGAVSGSTATMASVEAIPEKKNFLVEIFSSVKFVITNKAYWPWMLAAFIYFTALQLFLSTQNELISSVLQLGAGHAALLNSMAFGPVPIMLYFYNKLMRRKGIRFALQVSFLTFAIGIVCFSLGSAVFFPYSIGPRLIINALGAATSSFSIGAFFMMLLMIPSQVAAVELKVAKRRNSAMYFAGQGIVIGIAGALATGFIADFILRNIIGGIYVPGTETLELGAVPMGAFIAPFIVAALCLIAISVTFLMPKSYDVKTIGKLFDKNYVPTKEDLTDIEITGRVALSDKYKHVRGYDILNGDYITSLILAFVPPFNTILGALSRFKRRQFVSGIISIAAFPVFFIVDILSLIFKKRIEWLGYDS
ncbi:MAG: MFS transporter [Firmicutes bacterium]|nr:MFS transporter [Bacillota bacterium]